MPLGESIGLNYEYPFLGSQQQQAGTRAGAVGQEYMPTMEDINMEGLSRYQGGNDPVEGIRNSTQQLYDKYHKLRGFVESMWKTHGIDVTSPDLSDPMSAAASQVYQESIADLQFQANDLRNNQKALESLYSQRGQGVDVTADFDPTKHLLTGREGQSMVTNRSLPQEAYAAIQYYAKVYDDPTTRKEAQAVLDEQKASYQEKANQALASGHKGQAEYWQRAADAIGDALYDPTKKQELALRAQSNALKTKELEPSRITGFWQNRDDQMSIMDDKELSETFAGMDQEGSIDAVTKDINGNIIIRKSSEDGSKIDVTEYNPSNVEGALAAFNRSIPSTSDKLSVDDVRYGNDDLYAIPGDPFKQTDIDPQVYVNKNIAIDGMLRGNEPWSAKPEEFQDLNQTINISSNFKNRLSNYLEQRATANKLLMPEGFTDIDGNPIEKGSYITEVDVNRNRIKLTNEFGKDVTIDISPSDEEEREVSKIKLDKLFSLNKITYDAVELGVDTPPSFRRLSWKEMVDNGKLKPISAEKFEEKYEMPPVNEDGTSPYIRRDGDYIFVAQKNGEVIAIKR